MKRFFRIIVALIATVAEIATARAFTLVQPTGTNAAGPTYIPGSICPVKDGHNYLDPAMVQYLSPPTTNDAVFTELAGKYSDWDIRIGEPLHGSLHIDWYRSRFKGDHQSGAWIQATYNYGSGDPINLRWIQVVDTSDPKNGAMPPYLDPYPNDDTLPFYYNESQNETYGLRFKDFPGRHHDPTSSVTWHANLYLASWDDDNPGTIQIFDGIRWGFVAGCVSNLTPNSLTVTNTTSGPMFTWTPSLPPETKLQYRLQIVPVLPGGGWQDWTEPVILSNGMYQTAVTTPLPQQFFRLSFNVTNLPPDPQPPYFRFDAEPQTAQQGHPTVLSPRADGSLPIQFQWFNGTAPVSGATNIELVFPHVQFTNQGIYFVVASNAAGVATSAAAPLFIAPDSTPPALQSAAASSNLLQITVKFSEGVTTNTALLPGNYQLSGPGGPLTIDTVTPGSDESAVILTPSPGTPLVPNTLYFLQGNGISDFATPPNFIVPGTPIPLMTGG